jgi:hypothetical protein
MQLERMLTTRNEPIQRGREEWTLIHKIKKLISAMAPSAQPFRATGKGSPGRGSGPRLTDRKHYKEASTTLTVSAPSRSCGRGPNA